MAQEKKSKVSILTNGIIKENPVLRLVLGTCSTLAVTTAVSSALGMGAAFTFVLVCANIMISLLRKVIPGKVHLPCYIVIIAGFVTIVQMFMQAYMESLYNALGVFLPLIVVNCIILGRAEMFACKNSVVDSALDGIGMGIGYTLTVVLMATIREILGSGTWLGFKILPARASPLSCAPTRTRALWPTRSAPPPASPAACASAPVSSTPSMWWMVWPVWTMTSARAAACAPRSARRRSFSSR